MVKTLVSDSFPRNNELINLSLHDRLIKFSLNNLLSHTKPNHIYSNKVILINKNTEKSDINKYFIFLTNLRKKIGLYF